MIGPLNFLVGFEMVLFVLDRRLRNYNGSIKPKMSQNSFQKYLKTYLVVANYRFSPYYVGVFSGSFSAANGQYRRF